MHVGRRGRSGKWSPQFCVINELKHSHSSSLRLLWRNTHISSPDPSQPSPASLLCSLMLCHRQPPPSCSLSSWLWDVSDSCSFFTLAGLFYKPVTAPSVTVETIQWITCRGEFVSHSFATLHVCGPPTHTPNSSTEEIYCCFFFFFLKIWTPPS